MKAKRVWSTFLTSISLVVLAPPRAVAQSTPTVIKAKTIYTVTNGTLQNGEILIEAGKDQTCGVSRRCAGRRSPSRYVALS